MYGWGCRMEVKSLLTNGHSRCSSLLGSGPLSSANVNRIAHGRSASGRVVAISNKT